MAYSIYKSDGSLITVDDNSIYPGLFDPGANGGHGLGIQLIGRNKLDYGVPVAQSFLQATENFASNTSDRPNGNISLEGQLWYDKTVKTLYTRVTPGGPGAGSVIGTDWHQVVTIGGTGTASIPIINPTGTPKDGDIQVLTGPTRISIRGGGVWNQIFPAVYG